MTYSELYTWTQQALESRFDAAQLFAHVTTKRVFQLPLVGEKPVPVKQVDLLQSLCKRRAEGEPLQYLLGEWEFYGLTFKVGKGVLIPRADTETLVEVALELVQDIPVPEVLDLGSGSGCVAITIQKQRPDAAVTAVELSDDAVFFLKKNIALHTSTVQLVHGDLWDYSHPRPLDLVVTNPPYIPRETIASLQTEVRHEPLRALDGGLDGLDFYRTITRRYQPQIASGGWICMEVGIGQRDSIQELLANSGFVDIASREDLTGIPRVVYGRRP